MANEFLPNSPATVKPIRDVFVNKEHLNSVSFNFASAGSQVCDLGAFQHNQLIQLNTGAITVTVSCDGINFYTGPTASVGITPMTSNGLGYRYILITASEASEGNVTGILY